jgi:hypothetical protein
MQIVTIEYVASKMARVKENLIGHAGRAMMPTTAIDDNVYNNIEASANCRGSAHHFFYNPRCGLLNIIK